MRTIILLLAIADAGYSCCAQQPVVYRADLSDQRDDKLTIEVSVPPLHASSVVFALPRTVPGIYGPMDHGRLMSDVRAYAQGGEPLPVQRLNVNNWKVPDAGRLERMTYRVDDGWEQFDILFALASYRSSEGSVSPNACVLNANAIFGYFVGSEHLPCEVRLTRPTGHYIATSLKRGPETSDQVTFTAPSYRALVDAPMLVAPPDTAHIRLPGIDVLVACHSTTGRPIAHEVAGHVRPLLSDQQAYLGGTLPVDRYTFLIYHNPSDVEGSSMADGLEHGASTLILLSMPLDAQAIARHVYGVASHEFFHTLLPIGIHSEEIADYDFQAPRMSRHLWLYEGMTEYFAMHLPVKQGRQSIADFLAAVKDKRDRMAAFTDSLSLAQLSVQAMERQDQYYNFYLKGTLFCAMLDLELREGSGGRYGVQDLVQDLYRSYGRDRAFKDGELFGTIARLSGQPAIDGFLRAHLEQPGALPLDQALAKAGLVPDPVGGGWKVADRPTSRQVRLRKAWLGR